MSLERPMLQKQNSLTEFYEFWKETEDDSNTKASNIETNAKSAQNASISEDELSDSDDRILYSTSAILSSLNKINPYESRLHCKAFWKRGNESCGRSGQIKYIQCPWGRGNMPVCLQCDTLLETTANKILIAGNERVIEENINEAKKRVVLEVLGLNESATQTGPFEPNYYKCLKVSKLSEGTQTEDFSWLDGKPLFVSFPQK